MQGYAYAHIYVILNCLRLTEKDFLKNFFPSLSCFGYYRMSLSVCLAIDLRDFLKINSDCEDTGLLLSASILVFTY